MPVQARPQWTEVLLCPICCKDFSASGRQPVSLSCGHTACRMCLSKLQRQQCPFDQTSISKDVDKLPTNYAILQLVAGPDVMKDPSRKRLPDGLKPAEFKDYQYTQGVIEELAPYLKVLHKSSPSGVNGTLGGSMGTPLLSRPIQRKLVTLVNCQLIEEEGRARAVRATRSLGERMVTELIIQHQNPQQLSTNLWAAVRGRGCQFLGPAMQEETLKLVLLALEDGTPLSRKVLVMFVVQKLEMQFPQASKTSVGHVVQLLYRASCFKVTKRDEESSLMQLKEEFRNYDSLRREHDTQIVQIAIEAGLRISPEQWSSLLYGDLNHKSHMQSIIDKLQTPASFTSSIQELTICLQRSGDPMRLAQLRAELEKLAAIDPSPGAMISSWEAIISAVDAVKKVLKGLVEFLQNHTQIKKPLDIQTQNIKYKTSLCRDIMQKGGCPRGSSCTFAHSEEELEKYRSKSRQLLSSLNNQNKNSLTSSRGDSSLGETRNELSAKSINSSIGSSVGSNVGSNLSSSISGNQDQTRKTGINEVSLSLLREGDLPTFPRSEPPLRAHIRSGLPPGIESRTASKSEVVNESRRSNTAVANESHHGTESHLGSESRPGSESLPGSRFQSSSESSLGSHPGMGSESLLGSTECRYGSATGIGSAPDSRYSSALQQTTGQQDRFSSGESYRSDSELVLRSTRSAVSHTQNEDDIPIDDMIQASLYGLKSRTKQAMAVSKDPSSPSPIDRSPQPQVGYPKGNPLPNSNAKMYLANRSLSMNAAEQVERMDSERTHSSDGGRGLSREISGRRPAGPEVDRYSIPSDDGYFYERRLPSSESPRPYASQTSPAPQPRILVPSAQPAQPQGDRYERQPDPYSYHAPVATGGVGGGVRDGSGYLYPESPVLHQAPPSDRLQYRRPMVRRFIDPHTMKAYDVVPVDDYVEPSAPPPSLLPSQRYQPQPMYREHPDYVLGYDQRGRRIVEMRNPPLSTQAMPQGIAPQGAPSRLVQQDSPTKVPEMKGGKLPSHKAAIAPPQHKAPLRVERGPSLTELKERQSYLVNMLDEFQDDADNREDDPSWGKSSSSKPTSVWSSGNTSTAWSSPSDRSLTNSLWQTSSAPISSSGFSFNFSGINEDDDDEDIDHRKNGIDVDADDEIQSVKFNDVDDGSDDDRLDSEVESYNPWTSASLFVPNTGKAVKETATNYTMTYSKVLVRHVSTSEDDQSQKAPHGSHTMGDFEKMSMNELQKTLKQVEKEDQRAGSSHFERGHKIQIEMGRREEESPISMPHFSSSPSVPLPAQLVSKEPILHMFPKYSHAEALASSHGPVSGSARALGSNTGPLKVSAGMVENTMPVNMTVQDCQVAPGFQTPEGDGYYIKTPNAPSNEGEAGILQDDWVTNVEKLVECDPQAEEKLKQALNQVRTRIQAKETAKHAHNTFILDFEEKILENMNSEKDHRPKEHSHGSPLATHQVDPPQNAPGLPESRSIQMQESVLARYAARQPDIQHTRQAEALHRDQWVQQRGSPSHPQGYYHQRLPMDAYHSPRAAYPHLVPAGASPGWQGRYGPVGVVGHEPMDTKRHATKRQMEEADLQYAKRMQDKEHEEYVRHLEDLQRRQEQMERLEHQRRAQEERDRKMARELAMKEAMSRGYNSYQ